MLAQDGGTTAPVDVLVDHVVIVSTDPEVTCAQLFERTGLRALPGGVHEGAGTRNSIVPLGSAYLEIVEVHDEQLAASNGFGRLGLAGMRAAHDAARAESLHSWATLVADPAATATRLDAGTQELRRAGVAVVLGGAAEAADEPGRPFFLSRGPHDAFPGALAADHRVQPVGIGRVEVAVPGRPAWLDEVPAGPAGLVLTAGERAALLAVTITLAQGAPIVLSAEHPTGTPR